MLRQSRRLNDLCRQFRPFFTAMIVDITYRRYLFQKIKFIVALFETNFANTMNLFKEIRISEKRNNLHKIINNIYN